MIRTEMLHDKDLQWIVAAILLAAAVLPMVALGLIFKPMLAKLRKKQGSRWREQGARHDRTTWSRSRSTARPRGRLRICCRRKPAPAAGGWLSSIAGTKRLAARLTRGVPEAKTARRHEEATRLLQSAPPKKARESAAEEGALRHRRSRFRTSHYHRPPARAPAAKKRGPPSCTAKPNPPHPARAGASAGGPGDARRSRDFECVRGCSRACSLLIGCEGYIDAARQAGKLKSTVASSTEGVVPVSYRAMRTEDPADANDDQDRRRPATSLWGRRDIFRGATASPRRRRALTEEQEDAIAKLFNRMDVSGDGTISVQEAIKALSGAREVRRRGRRSS